MQCDLSNAIFTFEALTDYILRNNNKKVVLQVKEFATLSVGHVTLGGQVDKLVHGQLQLIKHDQDYLSNNPRRWCPPNKIPNIYDTQRRMHKYLLKNYFRNSNTSTY